MATVYELSLHSITIVTIVFQLYLFYLIKYESPKSMANYRFFLNYFTFWDLLFTIIIGALLQPEPAVILNSFKIYGMSSWISPDAERISAAAVFACGVNVFLSQDFCLIYRYTAILESNRYHEGFVKRKTKIFLVICSQLFSAGILYFSYSLIVPPEQFFDPTFEPVKMTELKSKIQPGEFLLIPVLTSNISVYFMPFMLSFFLVSEIFSVTIIYAILTTLRKKTGMLSRNTYRLHYQLTTLLAIQLAIPLFLLVVPISIRWVNVLITGNMGAFAGQFRMALITLYGLCNTLFTVIFVTPYRAHFYNNLIYPWLYPTAKLLGIKRWKPRRKSTTWVSTTRRDVQVVTLAKSSFVGSD